MSEELKSKKINGMTKKVYNVLLALLRLQGSVRGAKDVSGYVSSYLSAASESEIQAWIMRLLDSLDGDLTKVEKSLREFCDEYVEEAVQFFGAKDD